MADGPFAVAVVVMTENAVAGFEATIAYQLFSDSAEGDAKSASMKTVWPATTMRCEAFAHGDGPATEI